VTGRWGLIEDGRSFPRPLKSLLALPIYVEAVSLWRA
jgi:hypothetical protein